MTQLLWNRYGGFWQRLLEDAGAEVLMPDLEQAQAALELPRVAAVPGLALRLAVAQAFSLERADVIVAPSLNAGSESARGAGQDPWIADFPGALATLGGLPPIIGVPAWLAPEQETLVIETLQQVGRDLGRLRRVWDRHRAGLHPERRAEPGWSGPAGRKTVGVLAQPWLLTDELAARATPEGVHMISQHRLDPAVLRQEGARLDPRMTPTDLEALGAARLFSRRGSVSELLMIVDETSGSDRWLHSRVVKNVSKPVAVRKLSELLDQGSASKIAAAELLWQGAEE